MYDLEKVKDAIDDLTGCDTVALWNEYCEASNYYEDMIEYNNIDELCCGLCPSDVINSIDLDEYNPNDDFVVNSIYGWRSFDYADDEKSPFDINELAKYIVDNEETFGYLDEDDITDYDHYSDFDYDGLVIALDYEDVKRICLRNDIIIELDEDTEDVREELTNFLCTVVEDGDTADMTLKEHLMVILGEFVSEDDLDSYAEF